MRIGIVAGEASGDYLGAEVIQAIRARWPNAEFEGIAGPRMQAAGADLSLIERLEPTHPELPELLRMARRAGFRRLTVSTNGLRLTDEAYVRELGEADARVVLDPGKTAKLAAGSYVGRVRITHPVYGGPKTIYVFSINLLA